MLPPSQNEEKEEKRERWGRPCAIPGVKQLHSCCISQHCYYNYYSALHPPPPPPPFNHSFLFCLSLSLSIDEL
ncbi:hypothetical protein RIF29_37812 [Crotalaria pallida]|uniref:Uncharacterized protein n=1 Tax=Crotalaria pallida TaxID=3830 RepID=A0AAN9DY16_CROPI